MIKSVEKWKICSEKAPADEDDIHIDNILLSSKYHLENKNFK